MQTAVVGRGAELGVLAQLLGDVHAGPAVLGLTGEAGIGKTTVWAAGVEQAQDRQFAILQCRPAAAEVRLSYAGLDDLLSGIGPEMFEQLPGGQQRALGAALLRWDDQAPPDRRAVAAGFRSVLERLAQRGPVMVAIDDLQWLDEPTRQAVAFALRRCGGPVVTLTTRRVGSGHLVADLCPRDPSRQVVVGLGPLSLGALHHVLKQHLGRSVSRHVLVRINELSGGNPFFALELARSIDADVPTVATLPDSLWSVVKDRIDALAPAVREALLVASALAAPRVDLIDRALDDADVADLLGAAEDAGVVELSGGMVRFRHPLLAAAVYSETLPTARRAVHRRLSNLVDGVEERARHLALAAVAPDTEAVAALEAAAAQARSQGAPSTAAEMLGLAMDLGATDPARKVRAAHDHYHANNPTPAERLLEQAIAELGPGGLRAEALALLGTIRFEVEADPGSLRLLEQALDEASDPTLLSSVLLELAYLTVNSGRVPESVAYVRRAVEQAEMSGDDGLLAEALAGAVIVSFLFGEGIDEATLARALALEDPERRGQVKAWPTLVAGLIYGWSHRLDEAGAAYSAARQRCLDQGAESELWQVLFGAIPTACAAGDLETAESYVAELVEQAEVAGTDHAWGVAAAFRTQLWAWVGRVDDARAAGEEARALLTDGAITTFALVALAPLGMAELSAGDHEAAAVWLAPAAKAMISWGFNEPAAAPLSPDAAEALIALGRYDEAVPLVDQLEASGGRPGREWARAVGARCRALLLAARGQADEAAEGFKQALVAHDGAPQLRYDRARTLLVLGQFQRRCNQRRAAHASLTEAAQLFEAVGATRWAENARSELCRLGLQPGPGDALTPTERHVAELIASGLTNREASAALFVSPKTVEAHLGRVYRKLGIHSRAELGQRMAQGP